jgi:Ca-activated chloride channel family protein
MTIVLRILFVLAVSLLRPDTIWAQAEERTIYASVLDQSEAPVPGLSAADFIVREGGTAREVLRVSPATEPLQIAVLVDTSNAIEPHILELRRALSAFFKEMAGKHEIALIGFGERPTVLVDYTRDLSRLEKGIGLVFARPDSGAYLLEAIIEASRGLQRRKATRPVIVSILTEGPEFSDRYHQTVFDELRESRATFHSLALNKRSVSTDPSARELDLVLSDGTRMTGGRREDLLTAMALSSELRSLAAELNNQYLVVYSRPRVLIPADTLEVSVKRSGLTVRARRVP